MTKSQATLLLTLASATMILAAWGFQYIGGYPPCKMCYWQRYPHFAAIVIGGLALALKTKIFAWLGALAMLITAGIGIFHSGVERKLWDGPSSCSSTSIDGLSSDELFNQIMSAPLVRCDEIPWEMFGLTMANLNALASLAFAAGWLWVALKKD
ncbi:disulfide bond formation protein B [Cognatishimia activa]|uniref:Disulfide bond formation protein B n=1 Tax=Cognatishimia activa TaxID=1715691 RepID=A0A0P1IP33_9RHOB|nr:disulfide bond formation protein B [Cognatishimia activa]CUK25411.1 disulfide bond formation protein B [Cognatishimia activa]